MFFDRCLIDWWLGVLERHSFFLSIAGYVGGGIIVGFISWRWKKFFFFLSSFLLLFFGLGRWIPRWEWLYFSLVLFVVLLVTFWRKAEPLGRFFFGFWLVLNLVSLFWFFVQKVDLLRFLTRFSFPISLLAFVGGILALHKWFLHLFYVLLGSAMVSMGYLKIVERGFWERSFWGEPPFWIFFFLVLATFMYTFGSADK